MMMTVMMMAATMAIAVVMSAVARKDALRGHLVGPCIGAKGEEGQDEGDCEGRPLDAHHDGEGMSTTACSLLEISTTRLRSVCSQAGACVRARRQRAERDLLQPEHVQPHRPRLFMHLRRPRRGVYF